MTALNLQTKNLGTERFCHIIKKMCNIIYVHTGQGFQNMHQLLLIVFSPLFFRRSDRKGIFN